MGGYYTAWGERWSIVKCLTISKIIYCRVRKPTGVTYKLHGGLMQSTESAIIPGHKPDKWKP